MVIDSRKCHIIYNKARQANNDLSAATAKIWVNIIGVLKTTISELL
jgi:hypothetical protein